MPPTGQTEREEKTRPLHEESIAMRIDAICLELDDLDWPEDAHCYEDDHKPRHVPAAAIAGAVRAAWRSKTFVPSIHEFLEFCQKERDHLCLSHGSFCNAYEKCRAIDEFAEMFGISSSERRISEAPFGTIKRGHQ
jgi:hypothetical protein